MAPVPRAARIPIGKCHEWWNESVMGTGALRMRDDYFARNFRMSRRMFDFVCQRLAVLPSFRAIRRRKDRVSVAKMLGLLQRLHADGPLWQVGVVQVLRRSGCDARIPARSHGPH